MKIAEDYWEQDGKLIVRETHDPNPTLRQARVLRDQRAMGGPQISDGVHVARLPKWLIEVEAQRRGVSFNDHEAMNKLVEDLVTDSQYEQFRIWSGRPF